MEETPPIRWSGRTTLEVVVDYTDLRASDVQSLLYGLRNSLNRALREEGLVRATTGTPYNRPQGDYPDFGVEAERGSLRFILKDILVPAGRALRNLAKDTAIDRAVEGLQRRVFEYTKPKAKKFLDRHPGLTRFRMRLNGDMARDQATLDE